MVRKCPFIYCHKNNTEVTTNRQSVTSVQQTRINQYCLLLGWNNEEELCSFNLTFTSCILLFFAIKANYSIFQQLTKTSVALCFTHLLSWTANFNGLKIRVNAKPKSGNPPASCAARLEELGWSQRRRIGYWRGPRWRQYSGRWYFWQQVMNNRVMLTATR